jgi:hypothetical protein
MIVENTRADVRYPQCRVTAVKSPVAVPRAKVAQTVAQ